MLTQIFLNKKGTSLENWMETNKADIRGKRIFYVLKPNMETNIIKFGIAGAGSDVKPDQSYARLKSYLTTYGRASDCKTREQKSACKYGVTLYALYGTNYNPKVEEKNSACHQKELYLKRELRSSILSVGRGDERTNASLGNILKLVGDTHFVKDNITDVEKNKEKLKIREKKINYKE
jgi:hypothetical protein